MVFILPVAVVPLQAVGRAIKPYAALAQPADKVIHLALVRGAAGFAADAKNRMPPPRSSTGSVRYCFVSVPV